MVEITEMENGSPVAKKQKKSKNKKEQNAYECDLRKKKKLDESGTTTKMKKKKSKANGLDSSKKSKRKTGTKKLKNGVSEQSSEEKDIVKNTEDDMQQNGMPLQDYVETPPVSDNVGKSEAEIAGDFAKFKISEHTIELLKKKKIFYLFPVQIKTFDFVFDGVNVVAQARTGTGKTLSFALPLVEKLQGMGVRRQPGRRPKVLVMAPTRELALQVFKDFDAICSDLKCLCIYGGTPYFPQEKALRNGIDIVVGTPGRILDHINKGNLVLHEVDHVVLDEVDQMLDMGFAPSVEEILQYAYEGRENRPQTLLFSATCPPWVRSTAAKYMDSNHTEHVDLIGHDSIKTATTVQHLAIRCHYSQRANCIGDVVQVYSGRFGRAIIFTETKKDANELGLNDSVKVETQVLHGDIEQRQREVTLKAFRDGSVKCLVATNVAARGLDIPEVDLVVQLNPPKDIESYIHRSGRTGRAGRLGTCICFYKPNEEDLLRRVERTARIQFKRIGPPQPKDIIQASYEDTMKCLDFVPEDIRSKFLQQAEKVAEKYTGGALEALAAALAHMSGATALASRSLLSAQEGYTTWHMQASFEVRGTGFFWNMLEKCFGQDLKTRVTGLRLTKDKMSAVFDVPNELTRTLNDEWQDSGRVTLTKADSLPELLESEAFRGGFGGGRDFRRSGGGNFRGRRSGNGGGFSGRRNGNGGSYQRGMKRKWTNGR